MDETQERTFERVLRAAVPQLGPDEPLRPDLDLVALGLNSLGIVNLVVSLEQTFGVSFPDELVRFPAFANPGRLRELVNQVLVTGSGDAI